MNFVLKVAVFFTLCVSIKSMLSKSKKMTEIYDEQESYFIPPIVEDEYSQDFFIDETNVV